jgi:hypothetical protein
MKAFAEQFCPHCSECLVVRVGLDTDRRPKPYDYMLVRTCRTELIGLTRAPERADVPPFNLQHWTALEVLFRDVLKKPWRFDRYNHHEEGRTVTMDKDFEVTLTLTITKGGKKFAGTGQEWGGLDEEGAHLIQTTVLETLQPVFLKMGAAKIAAKKAAASK